MIIPIEFEELPLMTNTMLNSLAIVVSSIYGNDILLDPRQSFWVLDL